MNPHNLFISIVIPVYNEEKLIKETILKTINHINSVTFNYEIIVVNDGSKDKTPMILSEINDSKLRIMNLDINKGKGKAVQTGILNSKGEIIIYFDADLSYPLETIDRALKEIKNYDIVIGSRRLPGSKIIIPPPRLRTILGNFYSILISLLLFKNYPDTQCGFKCFKSEVAKEIFALQRINGFGFDVEVIYIALKKKFRIKQIPVQLIASQSSKVNIIKDSIKMFFDIFRIKYYDKIGLYK